MRVDPALLARSAAAVAGAVAVGAAAAASGAWRARGGPDMMRRQSTMGRRGRPERRVSMQCVMGHSESGSMCYDGWCTGSATLAGVLDARDQPAFLALFRSPGYGQARLMSGWSLVAMMPAARG